MAAQFTTSSGPSLRRLRAWMARATSSLPVPVSPQISTPASVGATFSMKLWTARISGLSPTMSLRSSTWRSRLLTRCISRRDSETCPMTAEAWAATDTSAARSAALNSPASPVRPA